MSKKESERSIDLKKDSPKFDGHSLPDNEAIEIKKGKKNKPITK